MSLPTRISYVIMAVLLVLVGWLHLGVLVLTSLFGYFAILKFSLGRSRLLGITLYIVAVVAIGFGLYQFGKRAYKQLPEIADTTMPIVVDYANKHDIELPFTDYESLKTLVKTEAKDGIGTMGRAARRVGFEVVSLLVGLFVAASLFLNARWGTEDPTAARDSLYATVVSELGLRFQTFFASFSRVIGAQIIISFINTALTAVFLLWNGFKFAPVLIMLTFLCGLLPIVGNLISNTLIIFVAFTISPKMALIALVYLVVIHKLEYFLNSKIIGDRIKNPMWLTLLGIMLGEKLMGIPGMILAPVVLHYIKVESSRAKVAKDGAVAVAVETSTVKD
jgi:predicted PurR-regulated permease PerM